MNTALEVTTKVVQNGQTFDTRPISVDEYERMIEHGILTTEDKVELLNGAIIKKMPKGTKKAFFNEAMASVFRNKLSENADVRTQNPIILDDFSEPEPDIVLAKPPRQRYFEKHPTAEEIFLIVEISDSTLGRDRYTKGTAYARAEIAQYLVFNVQDETIEDYRQPSADGYQSKQTYRSGDVFNLVAFPEIEIRFDDLL